MELFMTEDRLNRPSLMVKCTLHIQILTQLMLILGIQEHLMGVQAILSSRVCLSLEQVRVQTSWRPSTGI